MILCMTNNDFDIINAGYAQGKPSFKNPAFGVPYCYVKDHSLASFLGKAENLFITAHGCPDYIGNDTVAGPKYTPALLAAALTKDVIPANYTGSIYVSACDTAPKFVTALLTAMGPAYKGRIYGCKGSIALPIEPPANNMYILATLPAAAARKPAAKKVAKETAK